MHVYDNYKDIVLYKLICTVCNKTKIPRGGGGGGMSHWGLYIIRVNYFLKSTLNEDEATVPTALWTLHRACAPRYRSQISYPFRGSSADLSGGSVNLIPFFFLHIFLFSIPLTRYARYAPGGEKIPFLRVFIDAVDVQAPMRHAPREKYMYTQKYMFIAVGDYWIWSWISVFGSSWSYFAFVNLCCKSVS